MKEGRSGSGSRKFSAKVQVSKHKQVQDIDIRIRLQSWSRLEIGVWGGFRCTERSKVGVDW